MISTPGIVDEVIRFTHHKAAFSRTARKRKINYIVTPIKIAAGNTCGKASLKISHYHHADHKIDPIVSGTEFSQSIAMGNECKDIIQKKSQNRYSLVSNYSEKILNRAAKIGVNVIVGSGKATGRRLSMMVNLIDRRSLKVYVYQKGKIHSLDFLRQKNGFLFPVKGKIQSLDAIKNFVSLETKCERFEFGEKRFVVKKRLSKFASICESAETEAKQ